MGGQTNNIPPPSYTVEETRPVPSLPARTSPQHQQPPNHQTQPKPDAIPTGKLVGELATRAIGGAFAAVKTGVSYAGEVVTKASTSNANNGQPQQQQYGQQPSNQNYGQRVALPPVSNQASTAYPNNQQYYQAPMPQTQQYQPQQQFVATPMPLNGATRPYPSAQPYPPSQQNQGPSDYWAPTVDGQAWRAVFYFLLLDFPFALFAFVWCLVSMCVGCALLIVFPIGYPLLYLCTLSWRSLAHIHVLMLAPKNNGPHMFTKKVYIEPTGIYARETFPFSRHISDWYSWKCGLYFIFKNFLYSLYTFIYAILIIALIIPMMCLAPMWLMNIKRIYLSKQRHALKSFG